MNEIIKLIEARQRSPHFALWLIGSLLCLGAAAVGVWQILLNLYRLSKFAIGSPGVVGAELARSDLGETPDRNSALIAELIAEENSSLAAELIAEINECPPTGEPISIPCHRWEREEAGRRLAGWRLMSVDRPVDLATGQRTEQLKEVAFLSDLTHRHLLTKQMSPEQFRRHMTLMAENAARRRRQWAGQR